MKCGDLAFKDKKVIEAALRCVPRHLSAYSFAQMMMWRNLYRVAWARLENTVCVFFHDAFGAFMNCGPLGSSATPEVVRAAFAYMDARNKNKTYSRIENVEEADVAFYRSLGYEAVAKGGDYVYERAKLAGLRGDPYKSKRAGCNYFLKTYTAGYLPYTSACRQACFDLYDAWAKARAATTSDRVYTGMLGDSRTCLEAILLKPEALNVIGRIIVVDKTVRAFTLGCELNKDTFCILYEISDLSFKGISQYIFRQVCGEMSMYRYINVMDDSGLERLQGVKRSYRPAQVIPAYIIQRPHAERY
ncbi:MAG: phosphatidylglycerol lysyltransferase domain-containing protein [Candidatus Omnitrophota bacterium]